MCGFRAQCNSQCRLLFVETISGPCIHVKEILAGQPRSTTTNEYRYLALKLLQHKTTTTSQLSCELFAATNTQISQSTVARRLHERELHSKKTNKTVVCVVFNKGSLTAIKYGEKISEPCF
ncbi:hypothetical protein TNCV_4642561 [Trichonephila clavipes]|nr:hypothetical protein TNCV_4642561 [Trichonephila clavipes]